MHDQEKSKAQLLDELIVLRQQLAEREAALQQAQTALRTSNLHLTSLLETAHEAIISVDEQQQIILFSKGAEAIFRYSAAEIIGQPLSLLLPERFRAIHQQNIQSFQQSGYQSQIMAQRREIAGLRKSGEEFPAEASVSKLEIDTNTIFTVMLRDISSRKQLEKNLYESREHYRIISELTSDYAFSLLITEDGRIDSRWIMDTAFQRVSGYRIDELADPNDIYHPDDRERALRDIAQVIQTGEAGEGEYRIITRSGEQRWLHVQRRAEWDEQHNRVLYLHGAAKDVTARREAEDKLREREELYRIFSELISDYVFTARVTNGVQDGYRWITDAAFHRVTGYYIGELADANDVYHPDDRERADRDRTLTMKEGIATEGEYRIITKSGELRWLYLTRQAEWDAEHKHIMYVHGAAKDITARKNAENQLRILWRAIEQSTTSIVITDSAGLIQYINPRFTEITGYSPEETIGQNPRILKTEFTSPEVHQNMWQSITSGQTWHGEFVNRKKNGELFLEAVSISPVKDEQDRITHYVAVKEDITEQRRSEEKLRESEERYRLLAENVTDIIWTLGLDGKFIYISPSVENFLGYTAAEVIQLPIQQLFPPEHFVTAERVFQRYRDAVASGQIFTDSIRSELQYLHKDGSTIWAEVVSRVLYDREGTFVSIIGITRDISERMLAEKRKIQLAMEQERIRTLSQFVSDSTHDLMTSLTIIKTNLYVARRTRNDEKRDHTLSIMDSQVARLQNIIQDTLLLIKLDNTTADSIRLQKVSVKDLIQKQVSGCQPLFTEKNQIVTLSLPTQPVEIFAHIDYLSLALGKLIENAVYFTADSGNIHISAGVVADVVSIRVQDDGIGISEEDLPRIFERFYRAEQHRPTDKGTGLGLTIVQSIIALHHGKIEVTSKPGKGSTFTISLPLHRADATQAV